MGKLSEILKDLQLLEGIATNFEQMSKNGRSATLGWLVSLNDEINKRPVSLLRMSRAKPSRKTRKGYGPRKLRSRRNKAHG